VTVRHDLLLPSVGDAGTGEVSDWYRATGDVVKAGEPMLAVDIDKVTLDVPAPASGVLTAVAEIGSEVGIGDVLGWIDADD
jgi:2-oxoglutarate dehydrogenase E2 component (dihydrolipoamide succinyltransferase)